MFIAITLIYILNTLNTNFEPLFMSGKIHKVKVNTEKMCTKLKKNDRFSTAGLTLDRYSKTLFFSSSYEYNGAKNFFAKSQELPK